MILVRSDKIEPATSALPAFPEPTGDTVPDTIPSEWG